MTRSTVLASVLTLSLAACGSADTNGPECEVDGSYDPPIDPARFVAKVDHPFFPLVPGTTFVYAEGKDTVTVTVLAETKQILGVTCTVVHDRVTGASGEVIEDTLDWYAQDDAGDVWYMGEDTKEYDGGKVVSTEGSWEAGVDGAKAGIILPGAPKVGDAYRQEYYACHAEDKGEIVALDASVSTPFGSYTGCIETRDTTPLEPKVDEHKYYCSGVGLVLSVDVPTGAREELTDVQVP